MVFVGSGERIRIQRKNLGKKVLGRVENDLISIFFLRAYVVQIMSYSNVLLGASQ